MKNPQPNHLSRLQKLITVFIAFSPLFTFAQSLSPSVITSAGGYFANSSGSLSFSIGEPNTVTLNNGTNVLTQGFQQPEVQVRTGSITGIFCPGNNISIPFLSTGIISTSNVFTAQLSNASGNFTSPTNIGSITGNMTSGIINATIPLTISPGTGYRIRVISSLPVFVGPNNGSNISISNTCLATLNLNVFLEGYYSGGSMMASTLMNESIGTNNTITDTIEVALHESFSPYSIVANVKTLLHTDGSATCQLPITSGNYYIEIKQRNSIATWSANPVTFTATTNYNFTNSISKAYGNNMKQVELNVWAIYSGDINQDENIDLLDASFLETDINDFLFGYFNTDINGDGNVDLLDTPLLEENINQFIFAIHP